MRHPRLVVVPVRLRKAHAAEALPPGRVGYDLSAPVLLLHTIQSADAFDVLASTSRMTADPGHAEREFGDAYAWMGRQMERRLATSRDAALWFWARTTRRELVAACRRSAPGDVLLTCRVPRERVVLSHFEEWHQVLNGSPVERPQSGESAEERWERWEAMWEGFNARLDDAGVRDDPWPTWPPDLRGELEALWKCILQPDLCGPYETWQATTHHLDAHEVIDAVRILR